MKKLILSLTLVASVLFASAATTPLDGTVLSNSYLTITMQKYKDNAYQFLINGNPISCAGNNKAWSFTVTSNLTNAQYPGNYAGGTSNNSSNALSFWITAPYLSNAVITFHVLSDAGSGCTINSSDISFVFGNLPITWTNISVTTDNSDSTLIHAKWTTTMEQNVKSFTLQASTNSLTWDNVKTIGSSVGGNSSTATVYSLDYTDPLIAIVMTASFGLMGSILIIGLIASFVSKKNKVLGAVSAVLLIIMMVSCTKHNDIATPKAKKYHYFRVVETDLDGKLTYSQVFMIK